MNYFYIRNNEVVGCGQAKCLNDDIINVEVSEDMVNYDDNPTWESERYKWKWKWDGTSLIENPEFDKEEKIRYNDAMRQARSEAYNAETDSLVARKVRKQSINDWTEEDEAEFVQKMHELTENIKSKYPYKE